MNDATATQESSLSDSPNVALPVWVIISDGAVIRAPLEALVQVARPVHMARVEVTTG